MTTTEQKLQSLIARWRAKIVELESTHDFSPYGVHEFHYSNGERDTLQECSDELIKLLSESTEPCETH